MARGHPTGDLLEAYDWDLLDEKAGYLRLEACLPAQLCNSKGQLFGGFTPTYVDFVAVHTPRAGADRSLPWAIAWLATTSMHVDYFEPVVGPRFLIDSTEERRQGRAHFVTTRFFQQDRLAVLALTAMKEPRPPVT
ncbi:MAG: hypothetical protein ACRDZ5_10020 [Acidimicrobiales bacterium]